MRGGFSGTYSPPYPRFALRMPWHRRAAYGSIPARCPCSGACSPRQTTFRVRLQSPTYPWPKTAPIRPMRRRRRRPLRAPRVVGGVCGRRWGTAGRSLPPAAGLGGQRGRGGGHRLDGHDPSQSQAAAETRHAGHGPRRVGSRRYGRGPATWPNAWPPAKTSRPKTGAAPTSFWEPLPPGRRKKPAANSGRSRFAWPRSILRDRANEGFPSIASPPACTCWARASAAAAAWTRPCPCSNRPCRKMPIGRPRSACC